MEINRERMVIMALLVLLSAVSGTLVWNHIADAVAGAKESGVQEGVNLAVSNILTQIQTRGYAVINTVNGTIYLTVAG